jgi:hypothetical protein
MRNSVQLFGMICIGPMAPFCDRARGFSPLSACITVRIQCSDTAKHLDASVKKATKGRTDESSGRRVADDSCSACTAPLDSIDAAKITTTHNTSQEIATLPSCSRPSRVKRWHAGLAAALDRRHA